MVVAVSTFGWLHSFVGDFSFSLFCLPLAVIAAYVVHDRAAPAY